MAKNKVNIQSDVLASDSLSAEETKQMNDMKEQDIAEPMQEVVPEVVKEPEPIVEPKAEEKSNVPLPALQEERERRKAAEKKAAELEIQQARADERMKLINEALEKREKPQAKEMPDPERDALGALKMNSEEIRLLKEFKERTENQQRQAQQIQELGNRAATLEREYIAQNPDYNEASQFLINSRLNELQALGLGEYQARQQIMQETIAMANHGLQNGTNPAEMVYKIAGLRGYKKADAVKAVTLDAEKIERISEGQKANRSLTDIGGNAAINKQINAKDLANMSEAQFAKIMKTLDPDQQREVFGN